MTFRRFPRRHAAVPVTGMLLLLVALLYGAAGQAGGDCLQQVQELVACYNQSAGTGSGDFPVACCNSNWIVDVINNACGGLDNLLPTVQDPFSLNVLSQAITAPGCGNLETTCPTGAPWVACVVQSTFDTTAVSFSVTNGPAALSQQVVGSIIVYLDQQAPVQIDVSTGDWVSIIPALSQLAPVVLYSFLTAWAPDVGAFVQTVNITMLGVHSFSISSSDLAVVSTTVVALGPSGTSDQCCPLYSQLLLPNGCMGWQLDSPSSPGFILNNQTTSAAWAAVLPAVALSAASCPAGTYLDCKSGLTALQTCASASSDCCSVAALAAELCTNQALALSMYLPMFPAASAALAACGPSAPASDVACEEALPGVQVMTAPDGTLIPVTKQCTVTDPSYPNCPVAYQTTQATYYFYYPLSTTAAQGTFVSAGDACLDSSPSPTPSPSPASASPSPTVTTQIKGRLPASQKQALLDLYYATNGASAWNPHETPCYWPGIGCYTSHQGVQDVTSIWMSYGGISGTLPASFGQLTALQYLSFSSNSFTGTIPDVFATMPNLIYLDLARNQFTGTVPASLGSLTSLQTLKLSQNALSGTLPDVFTPLQALNMVDLSYNSLEGSIPTSLGNIPAGTVILSNNLFSGSLPCSFSNFRVSPTGMYLDVSNNPDLMDPEIHPDGCPVPSQQVQALTDLYFSSEAAAVIDWNLGVSPCNGPNRWLGVTCAGVTVNSSYSYFQVVGVRMAGLGLVGSIPDSFGGLSDLVVLDLSSNQLVGSLPASIGHLMSLVTLNLTSNQLSGSLPVTLQGLPALSNISVGYNSFSGTLPSFLGTMTQLYRLDLSNNGFTGSIPGNYGNLTNLGYLSLASNPISGSLPDSLGKLTKLISLDVSNTMVSGTIPHSLGNLASSLRNVYFGSTQLTGKVPCQFSNLLYVNYYVWPTPVLDFSNSQLSPPYSPIAPDQLQTLYQIYNNCSGSQWQETRTWDLSSDPCLRDGNPWDGVQCEALSTAPGVCETVITQLSLVMLRGYLVPLQLDSLSALTSLTSLDLSYNSLPGTIPASYGNLTSLTFLGLGTNQLTGTIPGSLSQLVNLQYLLLDSNQLTGTVPSFLGDFPSLSELAADGNQFTGSLPCSLKIRTEAGAWITFQGNPYMTDDVNFPSDCPQ